MMMMMMMKKGEIVIVFRIFAAFGINSRLNVL